MKKTVAISRYVLVFVAVFLGVHFSFELGKGPLNVGVCPSCPKILGGPQVVCEACTLSLMPAAYMIAQPVVSLTAAIAAVVIYSSKLRENKV